MEQNLKILCRSLVYLYQKLRTLPDKAWLNQIKMDRRFKQRNEGRQGITSYVVLLVLPGELTQVLSEQAPSHSSTALQNMLPQHGVGAPM